MRPLLFGGDEENQNSNAPTIQQNIRQTERVMLVFRENEQESIP